MILEFARAHFWPLFWTGCGILTAVIAFTIWYVLTEPAHDPEAWEDGWQVEPVTDEDAATMAAEWLDIPYEEMRQRWSDNARFTIQGTGLEEWRHNGAWHDAPAERTVTRDVWDEWWNGLDGLDRECFLVRRLAEREAQAWAELVAETRERCPLAVAA